MTLLKYIIPTTLLLLFVAMPNELSAQRSKSKEIEQQSRRVEECKRELDRVTNEVNRITQEKGTASKRVAELNRQMNIRNSVIAETEYEIELVANDIAELNTIIDSLTVQFEINKERYAEAVRSAYRNQRNNSYAHYIFSSTSLAEFAQRNAEVAHITDAYRELVELVRAQSYELSIHRHSLEQRQVELDKVSVSLNNERKALERDRVNAQSQYEKLSQREKEALKSQNEQKRILEQADAQLKAIMAKNTAGSSFSVNTRNLNLPIEGGTIKILQPNMVEISGGKGAKVRCVAEGTVGHISKSSGNHYIVKIAHGKNFYSVYTHVSKVCVNVGDRVKANQQIGVAGIFVDYNNQERAFIQFMIHNAKTGELESVMKFFEK